MSLSKFASGALTSGFLALSASTGAMAQDGTIRLNFAGAEENMPSKMTYVDTSDVMIFDVSSSMDQLEIMAAFHGASEYYLSERNISNYQMGICVQSTVIFFADEAFIGNSAIICSERDAQRFANAILSEDIGAIRSNLGATTNTGSGLNAAIHFFEKQATEGNIKPIQHRVVVVGDELQVASERVVQSAVSELTQKFDAQIFGIAIGSEDVQARFTHFMASDKANFPSALAMSPEDVKNNLGHFLRFTTG